MLLRAVTLMAVIPVTVAAASGCSSAKTARSTLQPEGKAVTSSASPSASATPVPVSPFEDDPAVKALRAWGAQAAKTINTGKYDDASLDALMTPDFATKMVGVFGTEVGYYYPGPLPFTPMAAPTRTTTGQTLNLCVVTGGYSQNPTTRKAAEVYEVSPREAEVTRIDSKLLISGFHATTSFSCAGVKVPEPSW